MCTRTVDRLAAEIAEPRLPALIRRFLYDQLYPDNIFDSGHIPLNECPVIMGKVRVFNSAVATFHAPSDPSGIKGMRREFIRCTDDWRKMGPRRDVTFLNRDPELPGLRGIDVVQIRLFFSFSREDTTYPCALVHWFRILGDEPDGVTGMWVVQQEVDAEGKAVTSVIHLYCIIRACHLVPVFGKRLLQSQAMQPHDTLTAFKYYYVNKYADHHMHKIVF